MRAEGTVEIAAPREATWDAITDPEVIVSCVPGAGGVTVESLGPTEFRMKTRIGSGLTSFGIDARGELSELERPDAGSCTIRASMAGNTVEALIHVDLADAPSGTRATWAADVSVKGPLAGMAAPFIEKEAPGLIDRTIACLRERLEGAAPDAAGSAGPAAQA